jgi:hypothetical protein
MAQPSVAWTKESRLSVLYHEEYVIDIFNQQQTGELFSHVLMVSQFKLQLPGWNHWMGDIKDLYSTL